MSEPIPVIIPLLNPNEPEASLVDLPIRESDRVAKGDILCTLETTKSTAEVVAEHEGFITGLKVKTGQLVRAGEILCYLSENPTPLPPNDHEEDLLDLDLEDDDLDDLRITLPARELAESLGIDLTQFSTGMLITEQAIRKAYAEQESNEPAILADSSETKFDPTGLIIYGGGGHAKSLIDLVRSLGIYRLIGIVDDSLDRDATIMGLPVLGGGEVLPELHKKGIRLALNAVGGIGNIQIRLRVADRLTVAGFAVPTVVHPRAVLEPSAVLSPSVQVFPQAYIGSECQVGSHAIVNTGATVSHECWIGDFANLSPGCILAGQVEIGSKALVGMGVTVNLQVKIGANARIGNGATIKSDVPDGGIVRAGSVWPYEE
jgi:acetyltransferase EpsM